MIENNILIAFGLTLFAGLSTLIGSFMAFFSKKFNPNFLCISLGFSAGVMIYISMIEIFPDAKKTLSSEWGESIGYLITILSFFGGIGLIALIDKLVPSFENPHEIKNIDINKFDEEQKNQKLLRIGLFSALAIAIHNFPEGLATFMASINNPSQGISIAIAIAIHNIPEGIAVSVPIYYATKNRKKAFWYSFISGLAEPVGAIIGFIILSSFLTETTFGIVFASVAGIMVYISFDELLPTAHEYGKHHYTIGGLVAGMAVMAVSLLVL